MVLSALRKKCRSASKIDRRAINKDRGFSRYVPVACGEVPNVRPAPHHSSSRPACFLSALYGRKSAGHLRRELRQRRGKKGRASINKKSRNSLIVHRRSEPGADFTSVGRPGGDPGEVFFRRRALGLRHPKCVRWCGRREDTQQRQC